MTATKIETLEQARKVIEDIKESHGYLDKAFLSGLTDEQRRVVEKSMKNKDALISSSITTLAKNLYTSSARFVFELIQNADDNSYEKAADCNAKPYISFEVHPDRIVIDSNEDGFMEEDVRAICSIGNSSKAGSQAYIGAKGIGFKSVFMVASVVSIQSGHCSFFFEHEESDTGLGMISPVWKEAATPNESPMTRITLTLSKHSDPIKLAKQQKSILEQFDPKNFPDTLLLFLKKMKRLDVKIYNSAGVLSSSTVYSSSTDGEGSITLSKTCRKDGILIGEPESCTYHIMRTEAHNLAKHDDRTYSAKDIEEKKYKNAEVVLAFPVDANSEPIIKPQNVYAFLPTGNFGFSFLIQSDFVTLANREGVVEDSERNHGLLDGVAKAFKEAVKQFCKHPTLQYRWMRYLHQVSSSSSPFWAQLLPKIKHSLTLTPILRTRTSKTLRYIHDVRWLLDIAKDSHGNPLFKDLENEIYLSHEYDRSDVHLLRKIGLKNADMACIIGRARADLEAKEFSRFKSPDTDDDWHSRAANLLDYPFAQGLRSDIDLVRNLPLIPLLNGGWISINQKEIFYSDTDDIPIPNDLGLLLVHPIAAQNQARKKLFDHLGVARKSIGAVREAILQKYRVYFGVISIPCSLVHLQYLYCTHGLVLEARSWNLYVYDHNLTPQVLSRKDLYLQTEERYSVHELLKYTYVALGTVQEQKQILGFEVLFLHTDYVEPTFTTKVSVPATWEKWLYTYAGVQQRPRFFLEVLGCATDMFKYLVKHRPVELLGALRHHWKFYKPEIERSGSIKAEVSLTPFLCESSVSKALGETYLPKPCLVQKCTQFNVGRNKFQFLQLPPSKDATYQEWDFLTDLGVGGSESVRFYLHILSTIMDLHKDASSLTQPMGVYQLYEAIQSQCWRQKDTGAVEEVRKFFMTSPALFVPAYKSSKASWALSNACLWGAPDDLKTRIPMESLCSEYFFTTDSAKTILSHFFQTTLKLRDFDWHDVLDELQKLSTSGEANQELIQEFYGQLDDARRNPDFDSKCATKIKESFCTHSYIYGGKDKWYPASSCLWSSTAEITGKVMICDLYPQLEEFFVDFIGVEVPNLNMLLDELKELARVVAPTEKIKATILAFNVLLRTEDTHPSPKTLFNVSILPVRLGDKVYQLQTPKSAFAIIDRQKFADAYWGKAWMLDFTLAQVRDLQPFFTWLGLERRYLSVMVKEISHCDGIAGTPTSSPERDITSKAHALFRCAIHFGSPRASKTDFSLYDLFLRANVYETDGISCYLSLSEDGREIRVEVSKSKIYTKEVGNGLSIYVPRDPREQEICYIGLLPRRLLEIIMIDPITQIESSAEPTAVTVIGNILKSSLYIVDDLLEEAGIIPVDVPPRGSSHAERRSDENNDTSVLHTDDSEGTPTVQISLGSDSDGSDSSIQTPRSSATPEFCFRQALPASGSASLDSAQASYRASSRPLRQWDLPIFGPPPPSADNSTLKYKALLDKIITLSKTASIPEKNAPMRNGGQNGLPVEFAGAFGDSSLNQGEYNKKIGAAGELFVYEVLSLLEPSLSPKFERDNWRSKIRKYVNVYSSYEAMENWPYKETADIWYDDRDGILTKHLIDKGYSSLSEMETRQERPEYYLEVKATPKNCQAPFYVSEGQYKMMHDMAAANRQAGGKLKVYVLIRVFNLGADDMNMRFYVDPWQLERDGKLVFARDKYSVVPTC